MNIKNRIAAFLAASAIVFSFSVNIKAAEEEILNRNYRNGEYSVYVRLPQDDISISEINVDGEPVKPEEFRRITASDNVKTTLIADRSSLSGDGMKVFTGVVRELLSGSGENETFRLMTLGNEGILTVTDYTQNQMHVMTQAELISSDEEKNDIASLLKVYYEESSKNNSAEFERSIVFTSASSVNSARVSGSDFVEYPAHSYFVVTDNEPFTERTLTQLGCTGYCVLNKDSDFVNAAELVSDMSDVYLLRADIPDDIIGVGGLKRIRMVFENESRTIAFEESVDTGDRRYENAERSIGKLRLILACVSIASFFLVGILAIVLRSRKQQNSNKKEAAPRQTVALSKKRSGGGTVLNSDSTRILFREGSERKITLTDRDNPEHRIEMSTAKETVIGRNQSLADAVIYNERSVSQRHCRIFSRNSKVYIEDLGSLNHTYADDAEVTTETEIFSGTILKIGRISFDVRID